MSAPQMSHFLQLTPSSFMNLTVRLCCIELWRYKYRAWTIHISAEHGELNAEKIDSQLAVWSWVLSINIVWTLKLYRCEWVHDRAMSCLLAAVLAYYLAQIRVLLINDLVFNTCGTRKCKSSFFKMWNSSFNSVNLCALLKQNSFRSVNKQEGMHSDKTNMMWGSMRCVINHSAIIYYNMDCILQDSSSPLNIQMQNTDKSNSRRVHSWQ